MSHIASNNTGVSGVFDQAVTPEAKFKPQDVFVLYKSNWSLANIPFVLLTASINEKGQANLEQYKLGKPRTKDLFVWLYQAHNIVLSVDASKQKDKDFFEGKISFETEDLQSDWPKDKDMSVPCEVFLTKEALLKYLQEAKATAIQKEQAAYEKKLRSINSEFGSFISAVDQQILGSSPSPASTPE